MATIKLTNTKDAGTLMRYCERKSEVTRGIDCSPEYGRSQFKATRELYGKSKGVQAHHIVQSFRPGEVTSNQANEVGQALAKEIAHGHEVIVYTHADRDHIHNHIVINAVNHENGRKYQSSRQHLHRVREYNDRLCEERMLSVVRERSAEVRYTFAERSLLEKGKPSWKDEVRTCIDQTKERAMGWDDFRDRLQREYGIETKVTRMNITYRHPDSGRKVRGTRLGLAYEKEMLSRELERKIERNREREATDQTRSSTQRDARIERADARLHSRADGSRDRDQDDNRQRADRHSGYGRERAGWHDFSLDEAKRDVNDLRRDVAKDYGNWAERNERKQPADDRKINRDRDLFTRENASYRIPDIGHDFSR